MIEFNVGGVLVDVPSNLELEFKKKNILYAFDDIEVERTTSFRLPKTQKNLQVFNFANDYHRAGDMMRTRVVAQMIYGLVTKRGYLYVSDYDYKSQEFECIFVTGELLGLKELREMGDISQFISPTIYNRGSSSIYNADISATFEFARIRYRTNDANDIRLSSKLQFIIDAVIDGLPVEVDMSNILTNFNQYRIITPRNNGIPDLPITIERTYKSSPVIGNQEPTEALNDITFSNTEITAQLLTQVQLNNKPITQRRNNIIYSGFVEVFRTNQDITLKFSADTSDNLFLATPNDTGGFNFIGDYSFTKSGGNLVVTGEPLAGRSVDIPLNSTFMIITPYDYVYETDSGGILTDGWQIDGNPLSVTCTISGKSEQPNGANIRMKDNVPAMSVTDFLKMIAALSGTILNYEDGKVIFESVPTFISELQIDDAIDVSTMKRSFADYAQNNTIEFGEQVLLNYQIDNVNISEDNVLTKVELYAGDGGFIPSDIDMYSILSGGDIYLDTITLPKNTHLENVISKSTTIELRCLMNAYIFDMITQKTRMNFDNLLWVWIEAYWSSGVARFTLSKV